ncbi:MAG: hypothetical protein O3A01_07385 [bacterium]|nr:hypothetical protein [bacterium]
MFKKTHLFLLLFIIATILLVSSCNDNHDHSHSDNEHGRGHQGNHDTHSTTSESHHDEEMEPESHTTWTKKTELFVEFPPLIVGEPSQFLAHYSDQRTFKPLLKGKLNISLQDSDGNTVASAMVSEPARPGIFTPTLVAQKSGVYSLVFDISAGALRDTITISGVAVYNTKHDAAHASRHSEHSGDGISFLKEQAWNIEFETTVAAKKSIGTTFKTTGELVQNPNGWILKMDYPKQYIEIETTIRSIEFSPDYSDQLFSVPRPQSSRQNRPIVRVERSAYLPKFYPIRSNTTFVPGSLAEVWVTTASKARAQLVVPYSTLLEQEGAYYLYVQTEGERFEKRSVSLKAVAGNDAILESGVKAGERVVSKGATAIKLSAFSGAPPGHGHAH